MVMIIRYMYKNIFRCFLYILVEMQKCNNPYNSSWTGIVAGELTTDSSYQLSTVSWPACIR